ncbi:hypothetical protein TYRP_023216 [Tyrophagus putrescentiae]|nr:hypothetical protein TYRP_023216 [Tyrophagus putrescentiae]
MFNAPEFADTFIKDITKSIDWFFNQQSTEPQEIQFRNKRRKTLQMIENRNANTVLRQLAALSDNQSAVFRVYKFVNGKELKEGYARTCRDLLCGKSKCIPRKLNTRHKF